MKKAIDKKQLRQKRVMTYFIEAAQEIIKKEGVSAVTIRNVADLAGFNSATLYNYFDNLNHVIFLATMSYLEEYNAMVPSYINGSRNSLEKYMAISNCFCKYSFVNPEVYELLFFTNRDKKFDEYTDQYYGLFAPKDSGFDTTFKKVIRIGNIYSRSSTILTDCVRDGIMDSHLADDYNEVAMMIYKSMLQDVKDGLIEPFVAQERTMKYYCQILTSYVKPEHSLLVEQCTEFVKESLKIKREA